MNRALEYIKANYDAKQLSIVIDKSYVTAWRILTGVQPLSFEDAKKVMRTNKVLVHKDFF